jgi:HD-GYP domain-containing protein (c-di-GMP phosphodiesterase class II)
MEHCGIQDSQGLLEKITALRQRLEQARGLVDDAGAAVASLVPGEAEPWAQELAAQVKAAGQVDAWLDTSLRRLTGMPSADSLPSQLTAGTRRLLERGRELLNRLRTLGDELDLLQSADTGDPLADWYRATVAMADAALRTISTFPNAPSVQRCLGEGVEGILHAVAQRVARLAECIQIRRRSRERVDTLAALLTDLAAGREVAVEAVASLARAILEEVGDGAPLRFLEESAERPEHFIACHSLNTAQVLARVLPRNPEWSRRALDVILAALLHDVGMLRVPPEILACPGRLDDSQRRLVEAHAWHGAELVSRLLPGEAWLTEAVAQHHERLDGTGYPGGLTEREIAPLARLLAVADTYAALCVARPHRSARDTRTALADTLLLAEEGVLDRARAEGLLALTFFPAGTVVELADGMVGVVAATPRPTGTTAPDRPVLALLTDAQGQPLPLPRLLDLTRCDGHSVVRSLTPAERRAVLGAHYPEFV